MMENTELINNMRACIRLGVLIDDCDITDDCHYSEDGECGDCMLRMVNDAADALEAAEKRIEELERIMKAVQENSGINFRLWQEAEAQMPKKGEGIINPHGELREMLIDELIDKGEWIDEQRGRWIYAKCNLCGKVQDVRSNYCPNCGARMRGEHDGC